MNQYKQIGKSVWNPEYEGFFLETQTQIVWLVKYGKIVSNYGNLNDFIKKVGSGDIKAILIKTDEIEHSIMTGNLVKEYRLEKLQNGLYRLVHYASQTCSLYTPDGKLHSGDFQISQDTITEWIKKL